MKSVKYLMYLSWLVLSLASCKKEFEALNNRIDNLDSRLQTLEQWCQRMNGDIQALQSIVTALQENNYIRSVTPIESEGVEIGYKILFTKGDAITIYHGIEGDDGEDGYTPIVGVKKDLDDFYYWTIDGDWLLDSRGNKIKAVGTDGADGKDGMTPQLKILDSFWYISYDNGNTWTELGKATGERGDSMFTSVSVDDDKACFVLVNGTTIELPIIDEYPEPFIRSLSFHASDNPKVLIKDLHAAIVNDTLIEARIPHLVNSKKLKASIDFVGDKVMVSDTIQYSPEMEIDFRHPIRLSAINELGESRDYIVKLYSFTGLPVMKLDVWGNEAVTSKDYYRTVAVTLAEDLETKGPGDVFRYSGKIKGRGNSTWTKPKKPYKLKFENKVSFFGEPEDKEWVLLANYIDKTSIRNEIAFFMGRELSNLPYTCRTHYVELIMNNEYLGTYQLGEQQKIAKNRVNVSDDGFLIEIDAKAEEGDITFNIPTIPQPINIKDPEVELDSDQYNKIVSVVTNASDALFSDNWLDPETGYKNYIDIDTFIDWFLINEISKNQDAVFFTSCYMNYAPGGKLRMGPLWDFDLAFGNANYGVDTPNPEGWYLKTNVGWYTRMFTDPEFTKLTKERFEHFYVNLDVILNEINDCYTYLQYSVIENNNKWNVLYNYTAPNFAVLGAYENEVHYLKSWLIDRMEWLKSEFDLM